MAPPSGLTYAAAATLAIASPSTRRGVASIPTASSAPHPSSKPAWHKSPDTGAWNVKPSQSPTCEAGASASASTTYTSPFSKPAWDNSPYWSAGKWASACGEVASTTSTPSPTTWSPVAPVTDGKFAKFKGNVTTYIESLSSCTSASDFYTEIAPELAEALGRGDRFLLADHSAVLDTCIEYLRAQHVPEAKIEIYYGKVHDVRKTRALEGRGHRVKYVKGDEGKVEEVLLKDSNEIV